MIILILLIPFICHTLQKNKEYKKSAYYQITKLPYYSVEHNTGRYGEYLTYKYLKNFETQGAKFLFNIFIPKENGETTEIDVLMLCSKGLFVFESKNYSGWIFGSEYQKNWYQTLPTGRGRSHKEHFYNPIMQNRSHIKHLKTFLGEQIPMRSIIVFSDRCTLQNVQIKSNDIKVINRYNVATVVFDICNQTHTDLLSESDITNIYNKLYPYTQVDAIVKEQHIANIHKNLNTSPIQQTLSTAVSVVQTESIHTSATEQQKDDNIIQSYTEKVEIKTDVVNHTKIESEQGKQDNAAPKTLKCPRCNANLVLRIATRGANAGNRFYGCSNFPKCKYIQNIINGTAELKR